MSKERVSERRLKSLIAQYCSIRERIELKTAELHHVRDQIADHLITIGEASEGGVTRYDVPETRVRSYTRPPYRGLRVRRSR